MNEKNAFLSFLTSTAGIAIVAVAIIALNFLVSFIHMRADLTSDKIYTLSDGSRAILSKMDTPVTLRFYATPGNDMPPYLKAYVKRIDDLLKEYEIAGGGNIIVEKFAPEPDTDAEEAATMDGVSGNMIQGGTMLYLGLAVVCLEETESIAFLDPREEQKLEYNLTRMIHRVSNPGRTKVGVMSSLQVMGFQPPPGQFGQPPMQGAPAWVFIEQLKLDFEVEEVAMSADTIPDVDVLLVVHPKDITDAAQFAIDQYVLGGGNVIAFVDPHSYVDMNMQAAGNPQARFQANATSDLPKLFSAWGVEFASDKILLDNRYALDGQNGKYLVVARFQGDAINRDDVAVASLQRMRTGWPGSFSGEAPDGIERTTLLSSSEDSGFADGFKAKFTAPDGFGEEFKPDDKTHAIAIKLTGKFKTAFPNGKPQAAPAEGEAPPEPAPALTEATEDAAIILVADVDFLHDEFWAQRFQNPFARGQVQYQAVEENNNFLLNSLEQLGGDSNLFKIRSRGITNRPLQKLVDMKLEAEKERRAEIEKFRQEQKEADEKLNEYIRTQAGEGQQVIVLSQEQVEDRKRLEERKKQAIKNLRETRKELRRDVERAQARIIAVNLLTTPLLVIFAGFVLALIRRSKVKPQ